MSAAAQMMIYEMPLDEMVFDFYDRLKSSARLRQHGLRAHRLPRGRYGEGDIMVNGEPVDALCHRSPRNAVSAAAPCVRS